jgi:phosphohistidine phosphatase
VGDHLRTDGSGPDVVLCSPATRVRQTVAALRLAAPVVVTDALYDAGGDEIIELLRALEDSVQQVLVVADAPGLPAVVHELADPDRSDPEALARIERRFPASTLASLDVAGRWADLRSAVLVSVLLP